MSKKVISFSIILLLVALGGYYLYKNPKIGFKDNQKYQGHFSGLLSEAKGDKFTLHGSFTSPASLASDLNGQRDFTFTVTDSTKITKVSIELPTYESLAASGKQSRTFSTSDLPKKESQGSMVDLASLGTTTQAIVNVDFSVVGNDLNNVDVSSVTYQILVPPTQ